MNIKKVFISIFLILSVAFTFTMGQNNDNEAQGMPEHGAPIIQSKSACSVKNCNNGYKCLRSACKKINKTAKR